MSDDFGNDLITISDEDGNSYTLEHIATVEVDDVFYLACLPTEIDENDDDFGLVILQVVGDDELASVDDEDLLDSLYDIIMEQLFEENDTDE